MGAFVPYLPVLVAVVTALFAAATYSYQKGVDRKNALIDLRRTAYQELLVALQNHLHTRSSQSLAELSSTRSRAFIVASDDVATAMGEFFSVAVKNQKIQMPDGNAVLGGYAKMILAMRCDCFENSTLTAEQVVKISPVSWGDD